MTPAEIITKAEAAGLRLQVDAGKLTVKGSGPRPTDLMQAVRAEKEAIMALINAPTTSVSEKCEECEERIEQPHSEIPMPETMPGMTQEQRTFVIDEVMHQGKPAIGWCLQRANAYFERFADSTHNEQDAAAALDLLNWQTPASTVLLTKEESSKTTGTTHNKDRP